MRSFLNALGGKLEGIGGQGLSFSGRWSAIGHYDLRRDN